MKASFLVVLCLIGGALSGPLLKSTPRKYLSGPPSEFNEHQIPSPSASALVEESAFYEIWLKATESKHDEGKFKVQYETDINVDSSEEFTLSFFAPKSEKLRLKLFNPDGEKVDLDSVAFKGVFPIGEAGVPETTYRFKEPKVGVWHLKVSSKAKFSYEEALSIENAEVPHGAILLWNKAPVRIYSHLNTYSLHVGAEVGVIASLTSDSSLVQGVRPSVLQGTVLDAEMDVILPDGSEVDVPLHDDGLHSDLGANDGVYGATIVATEVGVYQVKAVMKGEVGGVQFERTTQHLIPVVNADVTLGTSAWSELQDKDRMNIFVEVDSTSTNPDALYRGYAEVYGKDANNNDVAVCWISSMVDVQENSGKQFVQFQLNMKWLAMANAKAPITLKNVVLQETVSFIPVTTQSEISVKTSNLVSKYIQAIPKVTEITQEMRRGLRTLKRTNATADQGKLILIHGYCAGDNPWPASDFTNALFFSNPNANIPNEEFAEKVLAFAQQNGAEVFSVIGHSQGGMVGLHLLNYFETGLDLSEGGRRVQSVGTPYKGCSAAGSAASLGKAFGVGCGANTDLSVEGAKLWLTGVTKESQQEVYFYTTTYERGNFFGDYCNMAINAILEWPNDGTSELQYAKLDYGNNMGNTEKQCHTTDMKYMAQYHDHNRNAQMNGAAAR